VTGGSPRAAYFARIGSAYASCWLARPGSSGSRSTTRLAVAENDIANGMLVQRLQMKIRLWHLFVLWLFEMVAQMLVLAPAYAEPVRLTFPLQDVLTAGVLGATIRNRISPLCWTTGASTSLHGFEPAQRRLNPSSKIECRVLRTFRAVFAAEPARRSPTARGCCSREVDEKTRDVDFADPVERLLLEERLQVNPQMRLDRLDMRL
jgi:hypothetical protein